MTITIKLKTDNEAFEEDREGEIARIVADVAHGLACGSVASGRPRALFAANGDRVGTATVTGR